MVRQIVLDTETTGLEVNKGHRIIEIGCVEMINRKLTGNHYHQYINPKREIDEGAIEVHGITSAFLADKPVFRQVAQEFIEFVAGAELVIHNAPFDIGFINNELSLVKPSLDRIDSNCSIIDTLIIARQKHPGQRNNLDSLCQRYEVDNSQRELHGALLDAEILADVYLMMTGGQTNLLLADEQGEEGVSQDDQVSLKRIDPDRKPLMVLEASSAEVQAHAKHMLMIEKIHGDVPLWKKLNQ
mgnify:CR=1 FL=1